ncbi:hypothetical protein E4U12_000078 [Claviceps purpurea]|nr:hypothetical protein E4U12_000078 [Claviceps purpurea]
MALKLSLKVSSRQSRQDETDRREQQTRWNRRWLAGESRAGEPIRVKQSHGPCDASSHTNARHNIQPLGCEAATANGFPPLTASVGIQSSNSST